MKLGAVNVAAITPRRDDGQPDLGPTLEMIDHLCAAGATGIAMLGSTGEFLHLGFDDRVNLMRMAVKRSRVPVIAGVAHSTLDGTVALALEAAHAGAGALLVMPPYFFRYGQAEIREFYLRFADRMAGAAPLYLYNIPFFTSEMSCETACELLAGGAYAGIKDSSGNLDYFTGLKAQREKTPFTLIVGNDMIFTRARMDGADGVVSGVACAMPELMIGLNRAIVAGNARKVELLERWLQEFIGWLGKFPAPIGVKEATAARGLKIGPPSVPLAPDTQRCLDEFRSWFTNWFPEVVREASGD
ncbi:MAG: dihydrodipicolinate synthase family protein [Bryobacteraceae bacterium]